MMIMIWYICECPVDNMHEMWKPISPENKKKIITKLCFMTCLPRDCWTLNKPAHDKTYKKSCATSEDSDQPAHPRSLIRVFADRMCLLQPSGYPKRDKLDPFHVQGDKSLCWLHSFVVRWLKCHLHEKQWHHIYRFRAERHERRVSTKIRRYRRRYLIRAYIL